MALTTAGHARLAIWRQQASTHLRVCLPPTPFSACCNLTIAMSLAPHRLSDLSLKFLYFLLQRFDLMAQIFDLVEQIQGDGNAGKVDLEIPLQTKRLPRLHD